MIGLAMAERALPPTQAVPPPSPDAAPGVAFADATAASGLSSFRHVSDVGGSAGEALAAAWPSRGLAVGDVDRDGDVDVLLGNIDGPPRLLRNDGGNRAGHWLSVRLIGDPGRNCPRDAIGSVVICTAGGLRRRGDVASGRSQLSQSDLRVHFGLGAVSRVDRLEVRWANGQSQSYPVTAVDRFVVIDQARAIIDSSAPGEAALPRPE